MELFLAESPAKIAILGTIYSGRIEPFWNWSWNGIWWNAVFLGKYITIRINYNLLQTILFLFISIFIFILVMFDHMMY